MNDFEVINLGRHSEYLIWNGTRISADDIKISKLMTKDERLCECINEFDYVMKNCLSKKYRNLYNDNMRSIVFSSLEKEDINDKDLYKDVNGLYDSCYNFVKIKKNIKSDEIYRTVAMHELLHMASRYSASYVGFSQKEFLTEEGFDIGGKLNEGYTELLNNKLFGNLNLGYSDEMKIAAGIEKIIGQSTMMEAYFNADLKKVIDELAKYSSKEEALDIVLSLDRASTYKSSFRQQAFRNIRKKLGDIYINKAKNALDLHLIDTDEYNRRLFDTKAYVISKGPIHNLKEEVFQYKKKS